MPELTPITKDQLFEKKIAENTGSNYNVGDISDVVPVTKDQALLKEIALNSAGQSGDITELEGKVADNTAAIRAIVNVTGSCNVLQPYLPVASGGGVTLTLNADGTISCPAVTSTNPDGSFFVTGLWTATASGSFKFSGCPSGGSSNTYFHYLMEYPSGGGSPRVAAYDYGDGDEITVTSGYMYEAHIVIKTAATSLLFKPMLYDSRLNPTDYVSPAMTNRELTEKTEVKTVTDSDSKYLLYEFNDFVIITLNGFSGTTLPLSLTRGENGVTQFYDTTSKDNVHINISANGVVVVNSSADTTVSNYALYGTCILRGNINE